MRLRVLFVDKEIERGRCKPLQRPYSSMETGPRSLINCGSVHKHNTVTCCNKAEQAAAPVSSTGMEDGSVHSDSIHLLFPTPNENHR